MSAARWYLSSDAHSVTDTDQTSLLISLPVYFYEALETDAHHAEWSARQTRRRRAAVKVRINYTQKQAGDGVPFACRHRFAVKLDPDGPRFIVERAKQRSAAGRLLVWTIHPASVGYD